MTTTLEFVPAHTWLARQAADSLWGRVHTQQPEHVTRSAVLTVSAMPKALRPHIERAMVVCLRSDAAPAPAGADQLTSDWFTRWERDRTVRDFYAVRCRQPVTGTEAELMALGRVIDGLAREHGFDAAVHEAV